MNNLAETTGLDWIPIILGLTSLPSNNINKEDDTIDSLGSLDKESALFYISELEKSIQREENRSSLIELKSNNIIGFTAIIIGIITALIPVVLNSEKGFLLKVLLLVFYIPLVCSLFITIIIAKEATAVRVNHVLGLNHLRGMQSWDSLKFYKTHIICMKNILKNNQKVTNLKGTYLLGAQDWFRNTTILLLTLMVITTLTAFENDIAPKTIIMLTPTPSSTPSPLPSSTPSPLPSSTPSPLPSSTKIP